MVPIAYRSFGSGPDLLLISGQDATLSWWDPALLSDLATHYRVTVFDLPSVGYSGAATAPLTIAWLADITAGFAQTIGLSDPTVLGWGMGGEVALAMAERHRGLVGSLVLVDTSAGGPGALKPSTSIVSLLASPRATPQALSTLLFPATSVGLVERTIWEADLFAGTPDWMTARDVAWQAALQASLWKHPSLVTGLKDVTIPALVLSGADDVVFPVQDASVLAGELPHGSLVILAALGYGAIIQDAPAFVAALEKFTG
jgi:pimeloyl-ACP methyl ester carboxylesterase